VLGFALVVSALSSGTVRGQKKLPPVPDLMREAPPEKAHDWNLGPTGARGWMWGFEGQTNHARQILITSVAPDSPASGILDKGDLIVGVAGKPFDGDARRALVAAIVAAEDPRNEGRLRILRRRGTKTDTVVLKLKTVGGFSKTAPYDCPKSKRLLDQACRAVVDRGFQDKRRRVVVSIENDMNALLLLASGDRDHLPIVAEYAKAVAASQPGGHIAWGYAYETLFLAEYALATRDRSVMAGLKRLATDIAEGQSTVGTWGHAFRREPDGDLHGYGNMNQPGIVLTLAMAIAREAGVKSRVVDEAIRNSASFLRWYVDKGAVPYGDHDPWPWHEDNGKCSAAAVLFDLLGDREAATYFTRMAIAAWGERESGHTGNFFNHLWAFPGVSRGGPEATAAYMAEAGWELDFARGFDGGLHYQQTAAMRGDDSYDGWDCTGAYGLAFALPLKKIILTGKRPTVVEPIVGDGLRETVEAGRDFDYWTEKNPYAERSTEALMAGLRSWSPAVRTRSAAALATKDEDLTTSLLAMLASQERFARYGAIEALARRGKKSDAAGDAIRAVLASEDPWLRILGAQALAELGPEERMKSIPALLVAASESVVADPRRRVASAIGEALFATGPGKSGPEAILKKSLAGVDRPALYKAVRALLTNEDGRIRGYVSPTLKLLDDADLAELLPDLVLAFTKRPPSGQMFAYDIRMAGAELLARRSIAEGMEIAMVLLNEDEWGRDFDRAARALLFYGKEARVMLPRLESETRAIVEKRNDPKQKQAFAKLLEDLRSAPAGVTLVTAEQFRAKYGVK
jgi:Family of unknown function (DUF6288)